MTGNETTPSIPAGWYPDHTGEPRMRWWDGTQWTEHVSGPTRAPYTMAPARNTVPADVPAGNPFIWVIVLLPIVSVLLQFTVDFGSLVANSETNPLAIYTDPGYLATMVGGLLIYAASVILAYFDHRRLRSTGFEQPFHWAFAFLGGIVYIIGRSVVVQRRSGRGLAPLWAYVGVFVLSFILILAHEVSAIPALLQHSVPNLPTNA